MTATTNDGRKVAIIWDQRGGGKSTLTKLGERERLRIVKKKIENVRIK